MPPFCVRESGYGSFDIPIEIFFHGTEESYKLIYYLELQPLTANKIFNRLRKETITFKSPSAELRKYLISGGGILKTLDSSLNNNSSNISISISNNVVETNNNIPIITVDNNKSVITVPNIKDDPFNHLFGEPVNKVVKNEKIKKKVRLF
jgi:transcription initiation factor IIF auxiliary subunit